jgi:hypothetical protein
MLDQLDALNPEKIRSKTGDEMDRQTPGHGR